MSDGEDWDKWCDDDDAQVTQQKEEPKKVEVVQQEQPKQQITQIKVSEQKSKESDMDNVFDLFGGEKPQQKKVVKADLKKIGDNFGIALQNVGPVYTTEFLTSLLGKMETQLTLQNWQEIFKVVEDIYIKKRKQQELEEAIKKKSQQSVPKGVSFGKTKNIIQQDEDEDFDNVDDDDFM